MTRILSLALLAAVLVGCDATEPDASAPAALPPAAFALNTDAFPEGGARVAAGANYLNAAVRVGVVSTVVGLNLVLPAAATEAATQNSPTVNAGGQWVWRSTVDVLGTPVGLLLKAAPSGSEIAWRLVANEDTEDPFIFYTATTRLDGETGTWRLFHPEETGTVLTATFDVRDLDEREVIFRVPEARPSGGSSVRYATDGPEQTFDWRNEPEGDRALIVWDRDTHAGSIAADTYNGGARACWDEDLQDVDC